MACGMCGLKKLDHETSVELGGSVCAALGKKSKWQVQGTASSWAERSCISQCPQQWQMRNTSGRKYLGFSSNSCCLYAEDMQKKGLDLLSKPFPTTAMFLSKTQSIPEENGEDTHKTEKITYG